MINQPLKNSGMFVPNFSHCRLPDHIDFLEYAGLFQVPLSYVIHIMKRSLHCRPLHKLPSPRNFF